MSDPISSPGRGKTIVCIEDDPVQQGIYQSLLTRRGYEVIACLTGAETLEKLRTIRPDLLIIDLHLPDITGLELCDALLNLSTTTNVPFLFVSSDDREGQITAGLQKGAMDYIVKPFQPSALLAKVSVALSRAALTRRHRETAQLIAGRYEVVNRLGSGGPRRVGKDRHGREPGEQPDTGRRPAPRRRRPAGDWRAAPGMHSVVCCWNPVHAHHPSAVHPAPMP